MVVHVAVFSCNHGETCVSTNKTKRNVQGFAPSLPTRLPCMNGFVQQVSEVVFANLHTCSKLQEELNNLPQPQDIIKKLILSMRSRYKACRGLITSYVWCHDHLGKFVLTLVA